MRKWRRRDLAVEAFERCLEINPYWGEAHFNLGVSLLRREQPERALSEFLRALESEDGAGRL